MQTCTHLAIGICAAAVVFPDDVRAQTIMVIASGIPDIPLAVAFFADKVSGRPPLQVQSKGLVLLNNIFHSLLIGISTVWAWPLFVGWYSHLFFDWASHKSKKWEATDPTMVWPFPFRLRGLFDYRRGAGKIITPLDIGISFVALYLRTVLFFW